MGEFSKKDIKVRVSTVDRFTIIGKTNLYSDGAEDSKGTPIRRLSDFINKSTQPFLIMYECLLGGEHHDFLLINKNHIVTITESDH